MTTLHLGVIDIPYAGSPRRHKSHRAMAGTQTTGDVAGWLEDSYGVMQAFVDHHESDILTDLESSLEGAVESLLMGAPVQLQPFGSGLSKIEDRFKQFLATKEIEGLGIAGVPTGAALRGVSHRFKHPYAKRPPRPSFIDTGLFAASFKAWID